MKPIIGIILGIVLVAGCAKEEEKYANSCTALWELSPGATPSPSDDFIVRCCELIDGGDNPEEQSSNEGTCMATLLTVKSSTTKVIAEKKKQANLAQKTAAGSVAKVQAATDVITQETDDKPVKEEK